MNEVLDVKKYIKDKKVKQWMIADFLGIDETKLSKLFRKELSESDKKTIINAVDLLSARKEKSHD